MSSLCRSRIMASQRPVDTGWSLLRRASNTTDISAGASREPRTSVERPSNFSTCRRRFWQGFEVEVLRGTHAGKTKVAISGVIQPTLYRGKPPVTTQDFVRPKIRSGVTVAVGKSAAKSRFVKRRTSRT